VAPETETNYTLIGSRYGWRLTKRRDGHGRVAMEWRCPTCWRAFKAAGGEGVPSSKTDMAAVEAPSGTHSVAPPSSRDDSPTLASKGARQKKSTVPPPRRGRAR
jgi:hypothetical protein